jgi:Asp-tRNA(Asn)/Glu-tRNA(Gln) amidotransferase A subunit family amidase
MHFMSKKASPLASLRAALATGEAGPSYIAAAALASANSNAGRNVYLSIDQPRGMADAEAIEEAWPGAQERPALYGVPVSLKDCFDLQGYPTTCGSHFYAERNGIATRDSAVAAVLRRAGAILTGKTHLHQLAYGITGENADYGDCVQPRNPQWLTGGSSSGAAASVQEGSAIAAIGTDTGGSIRVPAAFCGLAGYRASHGLALRSIETSGGPKIDPWRGAAHLAPSFDTLGWLFRDLRDGPALAAALFDVNPVPHAATHAKVGVVGPEFLHDCETAVLDVLDAWKENLLRAGAEFIPVNTAFWTGAFEIFAGIQAHEASQIHRGHFGEFQPDIGGRLAWGASLTDEVLHRLRNGLMSFRVRMDALLDSCDYLILPCAPVSFLTAGEDHSEARGRILRYTCPMSLGGNPVVALPGAGGGVQLVGRKGDDAKLLAFGSQLGEQIAE